VYSCLLQGITLPTGSGSLWVMGISKFLGIALCQGHCDEDVVFHRFV